MKVLIEAKEETSVRFRYDEKTLLKSSQQTLRRAYPYAYGFVIGTATETEEAVDCFIVSKCIYDPGTIVECEIINGFTLYEGDEVDIKILATLAGENALESDEGSREQIEEFYTDVFKAWPEVEIRVGDLFGKTEAIRLVALRLGE